MPDLITSTHLHRLQAAYHKIQKRGIRVDTDKLKALSNIVDTKINENLTKLSDAWHEPLSLGNKKGFINLNSTHKLNALLKSKGFKVPTVPPSKQQRDAGETEHKESTAKLALQIIYSKTGAAEIQTLLEIAEYKTLKSRYVKARLYEDKSDLLYLSSYNTAGTLTGRRSSNKNIFGFGGNGQNFPKHTSSGELFLDCLIPRTSNIFLFVDQKSAEEWPVSALSENRTALTELEQGINRHRKLASFLFGIPEAAINKKDIEYYLGKKTRHANNYGMRAARMSLSLMQEGKYITEKDCDGLLIKVNKYDPSVQGVFHRFIREQISKTRLLQTPFGRERYFMGFRPGASNNNVLGEAFAYIPQSVVGDNTGFAVLYLETTGSSVSYIVQEGHDSIVQDVPYQVDHLWTVLQETERAFDRVVDFKNGFKFKIPVEAEVGFSFSRTVALESISKDSLIKALHKLESKYGSVKEVQAQEA